MNPIDAANNRLLFSRTVMPGWCDACLPFYLSASLSLSVVGLATWKTKLRICCKLYAALQHYVDNMLDYRRTSDLHAIMLT